MIIILKKQAEEKQVDALKQEMEQQGLSIHESNGENTRILGLVGDTSIVDMRHIMANDIVENVQRIQEPYKKANRKFHPDDSVIEVGNVKIGGGNFEVIGGPCSIESKDQMIEVAQKVKEAGAGLLRGGAFKPRTSPYSFQGLEEEGLKYMKTASDETGLATICEVTSAHAVESAVKYVSMLQVGARNMQNFELLKEVGRAGLPVLLKRGLSATIDEWLNAAEYIISSGSPNVALCERGIRTFETSTRNTLDLSAVCVLKERTHLPVIVDPSHATGVRSFVEPLAKAGIACGADGLMIEVHNDPAHALSDGPQSLNFEQFDSVMEHIKPYISLSGRSLM